VENIEQDSFETEEGKKLKRINKQQKTVLSYLHDVVFGLTAILLVFMLLFRVVVVSGPSMRKTLEHGDALILLSNVLYQNPKYGDIVVVSKDSFDNGKPIIKRVIAKEGQTVDIESGVVKIDGQPLEESYTNTLTTKNGDMSFPLTVPEGCLFVMGDNRDHSLDSRSSVIGLIDRREIIGKVLILVLPGVDPDTKKRDFSRIGVPY